MAGPRVRRGASLLALLVALVALLPSPGVADGPAGADVVVVFVLGGVSFEEAMAVPEVRRLARLGGVGLMTTRARGADREEAAFLAALNGVSAPRGEEATLLERVLRGARVTVCWHRQLLPPTTRPCPGGRDLRTFDHAVLFDLRSSTPPDPPGRRRYLALVGEAARAWLTAAPGHALVVVVVPLPSAAMDRAGDEVTPLVVAGTLTGRLPTRDSCSGGAGSLRSETTRRPGLVANVDVAPTVLAALGLPVPPEMEGSPVLVTAGPPPFRLHRLHLEQRRVRLPLQMAVLGFVVAGALVGVVLLLALWRGGRVSRRAARALRALALAEVALGVPLATGGLLPRLTLPWVVPFLALSTAVLAWAAHHARWPGPTGPLVFLGAASVAVLLVDLGLFGGRALRVPLIGGTAFDGARFYGLPNVFIAPLLAGGLFLAATLPFRRGVVLLFALGVFAGLPSGGANLGAAVTLLAAAGLWWRAGRWGRGVRGVAPLPRAGSGTVPGRSGSSGLAREAVLVLSVVVLGAALVLAVNRWLAGPPTHVGRFVAAAERGPGALLDRVAERLEVSLEMVADVPFSVIPLLGLAVVLAAVLRPRGPLARGLAMAGPEWGRAVGVLCGASIVAFMVNDTGVAAAAPGFLYAVGALLYPAFLDEAMAGGSVHARVGAGAAPRP